MNSRQECFVDEYLAGLDAAQAAVRAGYSEKSAGKQGWRLLHSAEVAARILERKKERDGVAEITREMVLRELAAIAFMDIADFIRVTGFSGIEDGEPAERVELIPTADVPRFKRGAIASIKQCKDGIELKLHDKFKALELLGRHLGMFEKCEEYRDGQLERLIEGLKDE